MALFVFVEAMLFAGFISAFVIVQSTAPPGTWPPPGQPRLPIERTAVNSLVLLSSGATMLLAGRRFRAADPRGAGRWMTATLALGAAFVLAQGVEWAALIREGLTLTSSHLGSFFYLIVGAHALHALGGLAALAVAWAMLRRGRLTDGSLGAIRLLWLFVVLLWPLLYWQVYL
jgi:cytochrome c oxidase subunit 3